MSWSANELSGLVAKAARGAGAPPEQAARFAHAAAVHLSQGRAERELRSALDALPIGPVVDLYQCFTEILCQQDQSGHATGHVPAIAPEALIRSMAEAQPFALVAFGADPDGVRITWDTTCPNPAPPPGRCTISDDFAACLTRLAARTLVPESDASRRAGAGAGLLDND
jgi:hypothetical protein